MAAGNRDKGRPSGLSWRLVPSCTTRSAPKVPHGRHGEVEQRQRSPGGDLRLLLLRDAPSGSARSPRRPPIGARPSSTDTSPNSPSAASRSGQRKRRHSLGEIPPFVFFGARNRGSISLVRGAKTIHFDHTDERGIGGGHELTAVRRMPRSRSESSPRPIVLDVDDMVARIVIGGVAGGRSVSSPNLGPDLTRSPSHPVSWAMETSRASVQAPSATTRSASTTIKARQRNYVV